jgi:hypothetical protein
MAAEVQNIIFQFDTDTIDSKTTQARENLNKGLELLDF